MTYTIDYRTGVIEDVTGTLEEAMSVADDGAAYTQCDIVILDASGDEVARRRWWGTAYDPNETEDTQEEIVDFGAFG